MKSIFAFGWDAPAPEGPPGPFNVRVSALRPGYRAAVHRAIVEGWLDAYITRGEWYVCAYELADMAGPGSDMSDPEGGCYIPLDAYA